MSDFPVHKSALATLIRSLVWVGRQIGRHLPWCNPSGLFFFFPFYHTGGAEKVHLAVVNCFADENTWVFFAKRSSDMAFFASFNAEARCFDIGWLLKYTYPLSVGVMAGFIGKHPNARIFGCNSLYYYLLLPHLPSHVRATDLLHALGGGAEQFALPVLVRLSERVVISEGVKQELLAFYRVKGVDQSFDKQITVIPNGVPVPEQVPSKSHDGSITVLFVGRGSVEKRIYLIGRAARRCAKNGISVRFTLVGELSGWLEAGDAEFCTCTGPIINQDQLNALYKSSHLVIIVSSREGFPLTVMEGMAQSCVPVCTAVGGIPEHISHGKNGWLLPAGDDNAVVDALCDAITCLGQDQRLLTQLSGAAYAYARQNFGGEQFCKAYRKVILG